MSPGWRRLKIGQLGRVVTGKTPPSGKPELFGEDHPFITPSDIDGVSRVVATERFISSDGAAAFRKQMIPSGAVCFVCIGATIGKMCVATQPSLTNQQINTVVVDAEQHDPMFVYYLLKQLSPDVKGLAGGAATPIISKSSFSDIDVIVAPKKRQRRIASILSTYDDLIENNTRRIAILEEMARRIYEEWFVRFRFPGHENVRMVESELGLVPEGWSVQGLYDVADLTYGFPFKSKLFEDGGGGLGVVRIRDIKDDMASTYTTEPADERYLIADGDVLVGMDGEFHMGRWAGGRTWLNQRVVRFRPKGDVPRSWLFWVAEGPIKHLEATIVGTTVAHLSARDLKAMRLVVPDKPTMQRAAQVLEPIFNLELALKRKNANLRNTRDLLLPKLISGELDVSALPEPEPAFA